MNEPIVYALVASGIMLLIGFPIHEFSHAWAAHRLGDDTARWQGRLTLDPRVHFDPIGGFMLVITAVLSKGAFFFGYAKPTPVNPLNLHGGRHGEAIVAAAGPTSNLVMATAVSLGIRLVLGPLDLGPMIAGSQILLFAFNVAVTFVVINVFLFLFNLLPIPPLDGWRVLLGFVPRETAWQLRQAEVRYASIVPFVFLAFIFIGGARILTPISDVILSLLLGT